MTKKRKSDLHWLFDLKARPKVDEWNVMFVDPGLGGTGWAYWDHLVRQPEVLPTATRPDAVGVIKASRAATWLGRAQKIADGFTYDMDPYHPEIIVFEFQQLWTDSSTSMAAGARGDLFKLSFLTGMLAAISQEVAEAEIVLVTPSQWKGQLSKVAVRRRIKRALGKRYKDHIEDAVGMGLKVQGAL